MGRKTLNTSRWKRFRNFILARDRYRCQESLRYGISTPAEMVHHIFPVSEYPELEFVAWNVISLSNKKHNKMHDRITNKITKLGKLWQRRRKKEFEKFYGYPPPLD